MLTSHKEMVGYIQLAKNMPLLFKSFAKLFKLIYLFFTNQDSCATISLSDHDNCSLLFNFPLAKSAFHMKKNPLFVQNILFLEEKSIPSQK